MTGPVRWGVILGAAVAVLNLVFALAGWHRTYEMAFVFLAVAIPINGIAVVLCLREQAETDRWVTQIKSGVIVGLVGSAIIFVTSWFVTSVLFPDYFSEMAEGYREAYVALGLTESEVEDLVAATAAASPVRSAFEGVVGTMVTSLVVAAVAGAWIRKKE